MDSEAQIRSARDLFPRLFAEAPTAVALLDHSGRCLETNDALRSICGRDRDGLEQNDIFSILLPPSGAALQRQFGTMIDGQRPGIENEVSILRPDGSVLTAILQGFPFPASARETFLALLTDVSGRRPFRTVVEQSSLSVFIYGKEGLEYVNPGFAEFFGRMRNEITPESLEELMVGRDRVTVMGALDAVIEGTSDQLFVTAGARTKSGTLLVVELRGTASVFEGHRAVLGTISDISARIQQQDEDARVQAALERAAREWRTMFDAVETPLLEVHPDGRIARVNHAAQMVAGLSYRAMIGKTLSELGDDQPWTLIRELVNAVHEAGIPAPGQVKDSRGRTWDILCVPFSTDDPSDDRVTVVAWDVTQVVELQASLDRNETMAAIGSLVAGVAHEVRNPLFAISATIDALEDASGGANAEYFTVLRAEIDRMTLLMHDLLAFGKPVAPEFANADVEEVIGGAILMCASIAAQRGVTISRRGSARGLVISADSSRMTRAVQNVIANAVQHSPAGFEVIVETGVVRVAGRGMAEISVLDSGSGFREDDFPRLFEPFFRRRKGGTGLGLPIVQQIITEHRGRVFAENRPEGGAKMTFRLPLAEDVSPD